MPRLLLLLLLVGALSGCSRSFGPIGPPPPSSFVDEGMALSDAGPRDRGITFPDLGPPIDAGGSTAPPVLLGTQPGSPANENQPLVIGQTAPNAEVVLFSSAMCGDGQVIGGGVADGSGRFEIAVMVGNDTETEIHAVATAPGRDPSACSPDGVLYVEDSTPPEAPTLTGTDPISPADNPSPLVMGMAEPGSVVRIFTDPACTSFLTETVTDPGGQLEVIVDVTPDAVTFLYADAVDAAGNVSECSSSLRYEDLGDAMPILVFPPGPALTDEPELLVRGRVDNPSGVQSVRIGDALATTTDGWQTWRATVSLDEGRNTLPLTLTLTNGTVVDGGEIPVTRRNLPLFGFSGAAFDGTRDRLLVGDTGVRGLRRIEPTTGASVLFSGPGVGTGTGFTTISGIAVDESTGVTYVADGTRRSIIEVDGMTGNRTTLSGGGNGTGPSLGFVFAVTAGEGAVYVAQNGGGGTQVIEIDDATGNREILATVGFSVRAIDWDDAEDRLIYYEPFSRSLRELDGAGVSTVISDGENGAGPMLPAFIVDLSVDDETGTIYLTDRSELYEVDPATGDRSIVEPTGFTWPRNSANAVAVDGASGIAHVVTSQPGGTISVNLTSGARTYLRENFAGNGPHFVSLAAVHLDEGSGRMFVADPSREGILEVDPGTGDRTTIVESSLLQGPRGVGVDIAGRRVFSLSNNTRLASFAFGAPAPEILNVGGGFGFSAHAGVIWDEDDELLYHVSSNSIVEYDPAARRSRIVSGSGVGSGTALTGISGLLIDGDRLIVGGANQVLAVDIATGDRTDISTTIRGSGPFLNSVLGIDLATNGRTIWAVTNNALLQVDSVTGDRANRLLVGDGPVPIAMTDVHSDPSGEVLWLTGSLPSWLVAVDAVTSERVIASW